jgi:hypothetical protein
MTRLKWKLISVRLEIVLILTQDECTMCAERTIGFYVMWVMWIIVLVRFEMELASVQDRCMDCVKRTIR